jgi:hypothetical protein
VVLWGFRDEMVSLALKQKREANAFDGHDCRVESGSVLTAVVAEPPGFVFASRRDRCADTRGAAASALISPSQIVLQILEHKIDVVGRTEIDLVVNSSCH